MPITIPSEVSVEVVGGIVKVSGAKGVVEVRLPVGAEIKISDNIARVSADQSNLQGLVKALVSNAVKGVAFGWKKSLELTGTGYKAVVVGGNLQLSLGFSHQVIVPSQPGIAFEVKENTITLSGIDRTLVGEIAAKIRAWKPADPYKAKGLKYQGEIIVRKAGKAAKAGAPAGK